MQLKKTSIRNKLAIATSTLLLSSPIHSAETMTSAENNLNPPQNTKEDNFSISGLYYSENDRVDVKKVHSKITKQLNEDHILRTDLIYDTMSGASPNGRITAENTKIIENNLEFVTFTTASGMTSTAANNSVEAEQKKWLTEFNDTRKAINLEWEYKASRFITTSLGIGTSHEDDYESYSGSGNIIFEFNQKRSSLNFGSAISNDTVKGSGIIPEGLGLLICNDKSIRFNPDWLDCNTKPEFFKPAEKIVTDYMIGFTQVWNRRTVFQLNYSFSHEDGYLTDPYKQISIVSASYGGESAVIYEKRPDTRNTKSLFFKFVNIPLEQVALNFSYRHFWDDWDISAQTADGRLRINLSDKIYIQGHGRLHRQSAAFFFTKQINITENKPVYSSADSRLGKLITATAGAKVGVKFNDDIDVSARVEHMQQHYYDGILPRMKVWIAQLILNMKF